MLIKTSISLSIIKIFITALWVVFLIKTNNNLLSTPLNIKVQIFLGLIYPQINNIKTNKMQQPIKRNIKQATHRK